MTRSREFMVGLVIILALAVGVVGTIWLRGSGFGRGRVPVYVLVDNVAQLAEGNVVTYLGVPVGRVEVIEVLPEGPAVRVTLLLSQDLRLPEDAAVVLGPESLFGDWKAEIVSRTTVPSFPFYQVPMNLRDGPVRVLGGYALPELSRLAASMDQVSANLANLTGHFEIAFNETTAQNLAEAIENFGIVSRDLRTLVQQQSEIAGNLTASADSALLEIEEASRVARRSFERIEALLNDAQVDSIVANVREASGSFEAIATELQGSSNNVARMLRSADSAFTRIDHLTEQVMAGQGTLGRLVTDTTLAIRTEEVLAQLEALLTDLRENPARYIRLSIF